MRGFAEQAIKCSSKMGCVHRQIPSARRGQLRKLVKCSARVAAASPSSKRLVAFVSGGGSNFKQIHKGCSDGSIRGSVVAIVTDVPTCDAVNYAKTHGIPVYVYPSVKNKDTSKVVAAFHHRMLNIHPSLLPAFGGKGMYGKHVHQAVISSGSRFSGATIHFVDEHYDTGPIVAQAVVPCYPDDNADKLAARVLRLEHELYPATVAALCDNRVAWREDGIPYVWQKT